MSNAIVFRIFGRAIEVYDEEPMLRDVYQWFQENAASRYERYVALFEGFL